MAEPNFADLTRMYDGFLQPPDEDSSRAKKRRRLRAAATALFIQHGYRRTSIDDVANRAGVAKGTVYLYYKTKAELLLHCVADEERQQLAEVEPAMAIELPPKERLRGMLRLLFVLTSRTPLIARLLSGDVEFRAALEELEQTEGWQSFEHVWRQVIKDLLQAIAPGAPANQADDTARLINSLIYMAGQVQDDHVRGGLSLEAYAESFAAILVEGIAVTLGTVAAGPRGGNP